MPRASIDPDEVRRFAAFLDSTVNSVRDRKISATVAFAQLHEVWRDEKYSQFDRIFAEAMKELERFLQSSENYSRFLRKKAEKARKYLDQRY